jgi:hypothetical protein
MDGGVRMSRELREEEGRMRKERMYPTQRAEVFPQDARASEPRSGARVPRA